jgi:hypothetical protein
MNSLVEMRSSRRIRIDYKYTVHSISTHLSADNLITTASTNHDPTSTWLLKLMRTASLDSNPTNWWSIDTGYLQCVSTI